MLPNFVLCLLVVVMPCLVANISVNVITGCGNLMASRRCDVTRQHSFGRESNEHMKWTDNTKKESIDEKRKRKLQQTHPSQPCIQCCQSPRRSHHKVSTADQLASTDLEARQSGRLHNQSRPRRVGRVCGESLCKRADGMLQGANMSRDRPLDFDVAFARSCRHWVEIGISLTSLSRQCNELSSSS